MKLNTTEKKHFTVLRKDKALKQIRPGSLMSYHYSPITKDLPFWDKNPTVILLWKTKRHALGINLHFVPVQMRKVILKFLLKINSSNIRNNRPLQANYKDFKGLLKKLNATVCIRKYLIRRIGKQIVIPNSYEDYIHAATELDTKKLYGAESDNIYVYLVRKKKIQDTKRMSRKRRQLKYK